MAIDGSICAFAYLSVCLLVSLSVIPVYLSVHLSMSIYLSVSWGLQMKCAAFKGDLMGIHSDVEKRGM